jgi:hypothetical protein
MRRKWRTSWLGRVAWPWLRRELEVVVKVSGVIVLSLWVKRLVEQFLSSRILNESILRGEMSDVVRDVEQEVEAGRAAMAGASNSGPPSEVIITVEPPRESWRRNDERRAEVGNDASTLSEWLFEEAAWFLAQFLKVAVSVAAFRGIHQLFRSRLANESAYRRAPDLWSHGHQKPEGRRENGPRPEWTRSATGPFADRPRTSSTTGNSSADDLAPDVPKYVASIEGHHLYLHGRRLHPAQQWPCPVLVQTPCRTCSFLEYDGSGTAQCVAVWKMKAVVNGIDGGESLDDVRDWIRNS